MRIHHCLYNVAAIWLFTGSFVFAQLPTTSLQQRALKVAELPQHPRLFADQTKWDSLQQQIEMDDVSSKIYSVVSQTADQTLDKPTVEYVDKGAFWHGPMRQAQGRIMSLAMMFRLTKEQRYLDRAKLEMRALADLSNWYPHHFLDTAEGALGMAIGIDWLHDSLDAQEREYFATALIDKALLASLKVTEEDTWVSGNNNWTAVCHGGLVIAAVAIAERAPELAQQVIDRALKHMPRYAKLYEPAGAYPEGPDYWAYGTTFYILMADTLRTSLGTSCDLERATGFLQTADYTLEMTAPSGRLYNFADNGSAIGFEPVQFWFARELQREDLIEREVHNLDLLKDVIIGGEQRGDASRMLPLALLWRAPKTKDPSAVERSLKWWSQGGAQPQAVMRSAWNDPSATFVGIKGGRANDSHAHMDAGSFIYEANRVRWAVDLGRESYSHARANGISNTELFSTKQSSQRWKIFRCGPESHNLLRFNNADQLVDHTAEVVPIENGFAVELTPVVADEVQSAERQFSLGADRVFTIHDSWSTKGAETRVTWQWLTQATATKTKDGFMLKQAGQTLQIVAKSSHRMRFEIEDVSAPKQAFDSPNPELKRLQILIESPANSTGWLITTAAASTAPGQ